MLRAQDEEEDEERRGRRGREEKGGDVKSHHLCCWVGGRLVGWLVFGKVCPLKLPSFVIY